MLLERLERLKKSALHDTPLSVSELLSLHVGTKLRLRSQSNRDPRPDWYLYDTYMFGGQTYTVERVDEEYLDLCSSHPNRFAMDIRKYGIDNEWVAFLA